MTREKHGDIVIELFKEGEKDTSVSFCITSKMFFK